MINKSNMKAEDLKIGNFVTVDNEKHHPKLKDVPLKVTHINSCMGIEEEERVSTYAIGLELISKEPNTFYEDYSQFIKFVFPILLTEEWLLKFGFLKMPYRMSGSDVWQREKYRILISFSEKYCLCIEGISPATYMIAEFEYVHQLQNLYSALTQTELTLKSIEFKHGS